MKQGNNSHAMKTIILVDRIGDKSRIVEMAKATNGHIIQMSMTYWVYELAKILSEYSDFKHEILKSKDEDSIDYIHKKIKDVNLKPFTDKIPDIGTDIV
jgi:hypothetical protein